MEAVSLWVGASHALLPASMSGGFWQRTYPCGQEGTSIVFPSVFGPPKGQVPMSTRTPTLKQAGLILTAATLLFTMALLTTAPLAVNAEDGAASPPSPVYSINGLYDRPSSEKHPFLMDLRRYLDAEDVTAEEREALLAQVFPNGYVYRVKLLTHTHHTTITESTATTSRRTPYGSCMEAEGKIRSHPNPTIDENTGNEETDGFAYRAGSVNVDDVDEDGFVCDGTAHSPDDVDDNDGLPDFRLATSTSTTFQERVSVRGLPDELHDLPNGGGAGIWEVVDQFYGDYTQLGRQVCAADGEGIAGAYRWGTCIWL